MSRRAGLARRGIDRDLGALVVLRPDQYVGHVLPLVALGELSTYLAGVLRVPTCAPSRCRT